MVLGDDGTAQHGASVESMVRKIAERVGMVAARKPRVRRVSIQKLRLRTARACKRMRNTNFEPRILNAPRYNTYVAGPKFFRSGGWDSLPQTREQRPSTALVTLPKPPSSS